MEASTPTLADAAELRAESTRLADLLVAEDSPAADECFRQVLRSHGPDGALLGLLTPAMELIGQRWAAGEITVQQEHGASVVAMELLHRMHLAAPPPRFEVPVAVGSVPGELHTLSRAIFATCCQWRGLQVEQLPALRSPQELVEAITALGPVAAVALSSVMPYPAAALHATITAVRASLGDLPLIIGGRGVDPSILGTSTDRNVVVTDIDRGFALLVDASRRHTGAPERRPISVSGEDQFRLMVDAVRDYAIFLLDEGGRVATWNEGARRINGWEADEIVGQHYSVFFPAGHKARAEQFLEQARVEGRAHDRGKRIRKDGSPLVAEIVLTALRDDDGRLLGYTKVTRDVTERERLETELEQSRRLEALGRMAGGVAHDFNNLLTAMLGHAALLAERNDLPDSTVRSVEQIGQAAAQAARMVDQLLTFSRTRTLPGQTCRLGRVIRSTEDVLRSMLDRGIVLRTAIGDTSSAVALSVSEVEQLAMNLVLNAGDAIDGAGTIDVELALVDDADEPTLRLTVADNGRGMEPDVRDRCFDPFFTTKPPSEGSGLGLAILYGLVQRCGGSIDLQSTPGSGTTFEVDLPVVDASSSESAPTTTDQRKARIVVVDDDEPVARFVEAALARHGHDVYVAFRPGDAITHLAGHEVDFLITDLVMPGQLGSELITEVRDLWPDVRCVAISGFSEVDVPEGVTLLRKPFSPSALVAALDWDA